MKNMKIVRILELLKKKKILSELTFQLHVQNQTNISNYKVKRYK